ncbi:MAG: peptidoglycan-binding protein [Parvibaculum sp.]|nr:peptidoglycan-binding protein [Parvibaculum sp.]
MLHVPVEGSQTKMRELGLAHASPRTLWKAKDSQTRLPVAALRWSRARVNFRFTTSHEETTENRSFPAAPFGKTSVGCNAQCFQPAASEIGQDMTNSGEHERESERSRKASQSGAAKGGEAAPADVPWQDEDFARISRIDAKQKSKRRKRKVAPETKSACAKPTKAEPATTAPLPASKAATPAEAPRPPLHRTQVPRPADGPALTASDASASAETAARRGRNPERRLDPPPFPLPPDKERKEEKKSAAPAAPVRPAAASPTPVDKSFTGPRLDPSNRRPSQAPVTEIRNIRHGAGSSRVPAGLLLFAAVGVGAALVSQITADLPSKVPNLVSSTEPSPARQPLDQAFTDATATPRAAQPQQEQEHEVASLPPPPAASGKAGKSVPPAANVPPNDSDGEAAENPPPEEEPGTREAEPENKEQQRAVSQPPTASGEAAPQQPAERSPAPHALASAEATLEPPEAATAPSPAGSEIVAEVQTRLSTLGYAPGPADGALREQTRDAIRAFQTDAGLPSTGEIDSSLVARLRRTEQVHWRFSG